MDAPSVYTYNNFRPFLADWQAWKQELEPDFTRSEFSRRLGLPRTRSFLNDVLRGKKVTSTFVGRFTQVMALGHEEGQFFQALVKFNQAESSQERELYFEQLVQLNRAPRAVLDREAWDYYKDWRNAALRCVLDVIDWDGEDPVCLGKKMFPRQTPGEVKNAVGVLCKLGMVEKNPLGFWKPTQKTLSTGDGVRDERVRQQQLGCLKLSEQAMLAELPSGERDTTAVFLSVSAEAELVLRRRLAHFRSEIRSIVHKDELPASRAFHLGMQLIPIF